MVSQSKISNLLLLGTDLLRVVVHDPALHLPPVVGDVDQLPLARPQHCVSWQRGEEPRAQDAALTVVTNLVGVNMSLSLCARFNSQDRLY